MQASIQEEEGLMDLICYTCDLKKSKEEFGVFCSQECRNKSIKKMERQKKQSEKRLIESELNKLEVWRTSGYRTY